jgi:hypothetical protein
MTCFGRCSTGSAQQALLSGNLLKQNAGVLLILAAFPISGAGQYWNLSEELTRTPYPILLGRFSSTGMPNLVRDIRKARS